VKVDRVAAWAALLRAHAAAVRAIESDLSAHQLVPLVWYDVLLELNAAPNRRLRMRELAARVTLSRTRVSRVVDELERSGLVEREPDPDDGRACFASITAEGRTELRRTAPHYLSAIETHFTSLLTTTEQRVLATALSKVAEQHSFGKAPARSAS
jgi:DNA-binding MarR family transcriptional regulator